MDKVSPQVSICLLTCNHLRYIRRCVESVVAQASDVSIDIIIGDDCSDDGTSEIVAELAEKYPHLITHIRHSPRIGGSENYLSILRRMRGQFIAHLDGDDYWLPGKLALQIDFLEKNSDYVSVYTNALTINELGDPVGLFNDAGEARIGLAELLRAGNFLNNSSMLFRTSLRDAILDIDGPVLDFGVHLRHARIGPIAQLATTLVAYRMNSSVSMVAHANDQVRTLYWDAIMAVPRDRVTDNDFAYGVADFLRRVVMRAIRMRRWDLVREWAPRVFAASPYGVIRTSILVAGSIFRITAKELMGRFRKGPDGHRLKILYRR